ncbi:MAG TPA: TIGR02452 family protein [Anaerolineaceae bacterium]|nr:TIGR02452 family protein [Anaerolineaceae bacterium]HPN51932.1 TIGR02452 family protein [Anaerolineaceae bacterium]
MKNTRLFLTILIAALAALYAGVGLFSQGGPGPGSFTTQHGQEITLYGRGLYASDSAFKALIFRGTDAVTLFLAVPALLAAAFLDQRGGLRARLFLTGMLAYFLYNSASLALGAAYNPFLLVYIACTSLSLFAFVMAFRSIDLAELARRTSPRLPDSRAAEIARAFKERIAKILWIGLQHGHDALGLGAWGCGAFGNDGRLVSRLFRETLLVYFPGAYRQVTFAIVDWSAERKFIGPFEQTFQAELT